jgi:hypothetical protein
MAIFDELKSIAGVLQEAGKIEQYRQILDIIKELLEIQKKNFDLETENRSLKDKLETKNSLVFERNSYWTQNGDVKDGPFCTCCWDDHRKTIRMQPCGNPAYYNCPKCENKNVEIFAERDIRRNQFNNTNVFNDSI